MRKSIPKILMAVLFGLLSTAIAFVSLYALKVIYYAGYQTEVVPIIEGIIAGSLVFPALGTLIAYRGRSSLYISVAASAAAFAVLAASYSISGPSTGTDLLIGALAAESFGIFFASLFQPYPEIGGKAASIAAVLSYSMVNIVLFLAAAEIYLSLGQAFLPFIVVYMELAVALACLSVLLALSMPSKRGVRKGKRA